MSNPEAFYLGGLTVFVVILLLASFVWLGYCIGVADKLGKRK